MLLRFVVFACLFAIGLSALLKAPIHKQKNSYRSRLLKEGKNDEFRIFQRIQMAKYARGGQIRFDKARQPLYDYANQEYNIRISIGTPGQKFELLPDTSEGNSWIVDKGCDGNNSYYDCPSFCKINEDWCRNYCYPRCCQSSTEELHPFVQRNAEQDPCVNKRKFDRSKSSTFDTKNETFHIPFGIGNVSGIFAKDTFTLGADNSKVDITGATFGLVDRLSTTYATTAFDGVLGLAFQAAAVNKTPTVFQHGVDLGLFDQPIFTVYLKPDNDDDQGVPAGFMTFGGIDTENCHDYTFVNLRSEAVWWFNADSTQVGGKNKHTGPFVTMASLGTDLNLVSTAVLYDLVQATSATYNYEIGFYEVDCSTTFTWSVFVGDTELKVDQSTLIFTHKKMCYLRFGGWSDEDHNIDIILGIPFLQQFCVSHDIQQGQLGFGKVN